MAQTFPSNPEETSGSDVAAKGPEPRGLLTRLREKARKVKDVFKKPLNTTGQHGHAAHPSSEPVRDGEVNHVEEAMTPGENEISKLANGTGNAPVGKEERRIDPPEPESAITVEGLTRPEDLTHPHFLKTLSAPNITDRAIFSTPEPVLPAQDSRSSTSTTDEIQDLPAEHASLPPTVKADTPVGGGVTEPATPQLAAPEPAAPEPAAGEGSGEHQEENGHHPRGLEGILETFLGPKVTAPPTNLDLEVMGDAAKHPTT